MDYIVATLEGKTGVQNNVHHLCDNLKDKDRLLRGKEVFTLGNLGGLWVDNEFLNNYKTNNDLQKDCELFWDVFFGDNFNWNDKNTHNYISCIMETLV